MTDLSPWEVPLDNWGLLRGPVAPIKRAILGGCLVTLALFWIQPDIFFTPEGELRPWRKLRNNETSTEIPWQILPLAGAFIAGVLY